ncbi:MAG: TlpA family protein disulfide reductase [Gammaproteobacteria bacterium]|nr:MAG: TlpA family protein disulfide reductase [Gammaproteobacteria bacterium]
MHLPGNTRFLLTLCLIALFSTAAGAADELEVIDLTAHKGKVVIVDFWASWCVPCRRSFPWLNEMQAKYADQGLVIIGVNEDTSEEEVAGFLADYPARFEIVRDNEGSLATEFGVVAMPSSYIIGRDGKIVTRHLGFKTKLMDEYEATIQEILNAAPQVAASR